MVTHQSPFYLIHPGPDAPIGMDGPFPQPRSITRIERSYEEDNRSSPDPQ